MLTALYTMGKVARQTASCLLPHKPATDANLVIRMITLLMAFGTTQRACARLPDAHFHWYCAHDARGPNRCRACHVPQAKETVKKLTEKLQNRDLETRPGRTMLETFEDEVNQALNKARDDSGKEAQRSLDASNNVVRMVSAGSKGSFINISQVRPPLTS